MVYQGMAPASWDKNLLNCLQYTTFHLKIALL